MKVTISITTLIAGFAMRSVEGAGSPAAAMMYSGSDRYAEYGVCNLQSLHPVIPLRNNPGSPHTATNGRLMGHRECLEFCGRQHNRPELSTIPLPVFAFGSRQDKLIASLSSMTR